MAAKKKLREPVTFEELVAAVDLDGLTYYELGGKLREEGEPTDDADSTEVDTNWGIRTRHEGREFGVRVRAEASTPHGVLIADISAEYVSDEQLRIPKDVAYQFVNDVAMMQIVPFIREAFLTLSQKVFGEGLIMPILQRGDITFAPSASGPDISEG